MEQTTQQKAPPWALLFTVIFGVLLAGIDRTVTNLALPNIILDFHSTVATASWVATVYIITSAIFIPIFGKLGDIYGDRPVFMAGMGGFVATSLLTAFAWNMPSLIAFRALQGICGASLLPTAMAAIAKGFTERTARAQALGILTSGAAGAAAIAPLIGGPLIDTFVWRSVFFINLPLGIISLILAYLFIRNDHIPKSQSLDIAGSVVLGGALTSLVLVIDRGSTWGWTSSYSVLCYALIILLTLLFTYQQSRTKNPTTTSGLITTFLVGMSLTSVVFLLSLFAQQVLGYSATRAGYLFLPLVVPLLFISPIGGKLSKKLPSGYAIAIGMIGAAASIFFLSRVDITLGIKATALPMILFGMFWGITSAPLSSAIANSVAPENVGMVSGLRSLFISIGGAVGIALYSGIYSRNIIDGIAYTETFRTLYGLSAGVLIIGAVISLFVREPKTQS
jgi:EmrB/QacA subfamily drug resistance transporter